MRFAIRILSERLQKEREGQVMWQGILDREMPQEPRGVEREIPGMIDKYERQLEDWHASQRQASKNLPSGESRISDIETALGILRDTKDC